MSEDSSAIKIESHKYRQGIRDQLAELIGIEAASRGVSKAAVGRELGLDRKSLHRVLSGQTTIDNALLYLKRLGVEVEVNIISGSKSRTEENKNDDTSTFCA